MDRQHMDRINRNRKRRMRLVTTVMVLFLFWAGYTWLNQNSALDEKSAQLQVLKEESAELEQQQAQLKSKVEKLHDEEYIAELARKNYFLSKPGEVIFVVPEEE